MHFIEAALFLLFLAIISVPLAVRLRLPLEIFLVIGSCIISLIPGLPNLAINPDLVFKIFLPPILFYAAYFTSWQDFKFNLRPISLLAFGLVIFTTALVAIVAKWCIPGFTWAEGFLLGAIISPTDASSAVSIIKRLGAQRRIVAILEGESLVNDATALLLFRFSLTAILLGTFSFSHAILNFFIIILGGALIGIITSMVGIYILRKVCQPQAVTTFTFLIAFTSFIVAEHLEFSGVISTVVCGIYFGRRFPLYVASQTRINAKSSWNTLIFIINGLVFTLLGLQLPFILKGMSHYSWWNLLLFGAAIVGTVILARLIWIYPAAYIPRKLFPSIARRDPLPSWQMLFVLGWTGMRGIVSLAAALSIPMFSSSGADFPHRNLFLFITYCVVVATLIIPVFTLPVLISIFKLIENPQDQLREEAVARIKSLEGVMDRLAEIIKKEKIPNHVFEEFRQQLERRFDIIRTQLNESPYSTLNADYIALKKLALAAIESERETLNKLRQTAEIRDEVYHKLSDELDYEELRARGVRM